MTSVVGLCVVDMFRHYRYTELKMHGRDQIEIDNVRILKFSDQICGELKEWERKKPRSSQAKDDDRHQLCRVTQKDSLSTTAAPTEKQLQAGRTTGTCCRLTCFVCRKHITQKGERRRQQTIWWCKKCHMPLCRSSRVGEDGGRELTCLEEHLTATDDVFNCSQPIPRGAEVPDEHSVDLHARKSTRKKRRRNNRG